MRDQRYGSATSEPAVSIIPHATPLVTAQARHCQTLLHPSSRSGCACRVAFDEDQQRASS
eukprot:3934286-Rhodomonas_salina.2